MIKGLVGLGFEASSRATPHARLPVFVAQVPWLKVAAVPTRARRAGSTLEAEQRRSRRLK